MSISKKFKNEEEIENFFCKNERHKSIAFEKAVMTCIKKNKELSLFNLLIEYELIITVSNAKKRFDINN